MDLLGKFDDFFKSLNSTSTVTPDLLLFSERNGLEVTDLVEKVDAVNQRVCLNILVTNLEEVFVSEVSVTFVESLVQTSVATLHHLLDANVLNDVDETLRNSAFVRPVVRCVECVTNLMRNQQVKDGLASTLPHRKGQHATLHVELCCRDVAVLNDQVFLSEQFGELSFDFEHCSSDMYI